MVRTITRTTVDAPVTPTCPACDSHNVSDATGLGNCGDCGLTDNLSAFMGGGMTANVKFQPSKFARGGGSARGWTISGQVD